MSLDLKKENGQCLYTARNGADVVGFVAIDSKVEGRARGGLRMLPDVSIEEIRDASRAMTLKYGFLGLPQGGAKAGVRGDGEASSAEKQARLVEFAQIAAPLLRDRIYVPDSDLGTTADDIRAMMQSLGVKISRREWRTGRSGFYTAASCLVSATAVLCHQGHTPTGQRVAIEGFGQVGSNLADLMHKKGAKVVAVSSSRGAVYDPEGLDIDQLIGLAETHGSNFVQHVGSRLQLQRGALLELPVDLLCPCARRHSIDKANAERVSAPLICPGANDPISPAAERVLLSRGAIVLPDFVTNSGGVLGGTLEFTGIELASIVAFFEQFYAERVGALLDSAESQGLSPRALAESEALDRHARIRHSAQNPSLVGRLFDLGLEAYRRGWIPQSLVARLSPMYLRKLLKN